jgi:hypothetical protein
MTNRYSILACLLFISLFVFAPMATAQVCSDPNDPRTCLFDQSPPDPDSTAPGMTSCTTTQGCKKCGLSDRTHMNECYTAFMEDGSCDCTTPSSNTILMSQCSLTGNCTYKP